MEQTSVTPMHRETAADKTRNLTKMALCVAFLAISSYLAFPLPFTPAMVVGTTIIVNMTAFILKPNDAFLVVLAWLLIGAIGVPVLPGGSAGLGRLLGPTGGFYVCFAIAAWLMSKLLGNCGWYADHLRGRLRLHVSGGPHGCMGYTGGSGISFHLRRCGEGAGRCVPGNADQYVFEKLISVSLTVDSDTSIKLPVWNQAGNFLNMIFLSVW